MSRLPVFASSIVGIGVVEECPKYLSLDSGELSRTEYSWLMRAISISQLDMSGRSNHGAIVVKGGSLIGVGINRSRTHNKWVTYMERQYCTTHAEVSAMRNADFPLRATIYVARTNRTGQLRASAPCSSCRGFLENFDVKKVIHT